MAGDWIKMRVTLAKDPRVIAMADRLAVNRGFIDWLCDPVRASCNETAYEHVTRNVTVAVTVSALLQVWGIANETGKPEGEDLLLCHTRIDHIDGVCGVPGFGEAMEFVEWAIEEVDCGKYRVRLPKFLINNTPAEDRAKKANAERQRRFREKSNAASNGISNVTGNVTVTPREEKRREEKKEQEEQKQEHLPPSSATKMATSLSKDWKPSPEQIAQARESRPDVDVELEAQKFVDYWIAKGGKEGRKLDWDATWRNWIRNARGAPRGAVHDPDWRKVAV